MSGLKIKGNLYGRRPHAAVFLSDPGHGNRGMDDQRQYIAGYKRGPHSVWNIYETLKTEKEEKT